MVAADGRDFHFAFGTPPPRKKCAKSSKEESSARTSVGGIALLCAASGGLADCGDLIPGVPIVKDGRVKSF
jgi:hypothetical protein